MPPIVFSCKSWSMVKGLDQLLHSPRWSWGLALSLGQGHAPVCFLLRALAHAPQSALLTGLPPTYLQNGNWWSPAPSRRSCPCRHRPAAVSPNAGFSSTAPGDVPLGGVHGLVCRHTAQLESDRAVDGDLGASAVGTDCHPSLWATPVTDEWVTGLPRRAATNRPGCCRGRRRPEQQEGSVPAVPRLLVSSYPPHCCVTAGFLAQVRILPGHSSLQACRGWLTPRPLSSGRPSTSGWGSRSNARG